MTNQLWWVNDGVHRLWSLDALSMVRVKERAVLLTDAIMSVNSCTWPRGIGFLGRGRVEKR